MGRRVCVSCEGEHDPMKHELRGMGSGIDPRGIAASVIQSQRVESVLRALGYDTLAVYRVQQQIADRFTTTTLSWEEATDAVLDPIFAGREPKHDR